MQILVKHNNSVANNDYRFHHSAAAFQLSFCYLIKPDNSNRQKKDAFFLLLGGTIIIGSLVLKIGRLDKGVPQFPKSGISKAIFTPGGL